ncbi:sugar ABC transporter permease [Herbiconiux sp. CPCC 205716]|uniref:Sugar ABC transporter permease n=1 Tax=Herbiconiux gentiana TaxID=2970912 RepID=A0ABT2GJR1_9MICO|nr:sugar ABC transporter permease [Herbiconiux gentiana]MCS5716458.1 sugar ABC transporter permease [Herbiconiux gentiana]
MTDTRVSRPTRSSSSLRHRRRRGVRSRWGYLLPAGVFLAALAVFPLVQLLRLSLSDVQVQNLHRDWPFIGLENFINGFTSGVLTDGLLNTLVFVVIVTIIGLIGGIAAAVALRGTGQVTGALLGLMVFIWALPPVVNGSVWKFLLADDGLFNSMLSLFGLSSFPFLYDERYALISVAVVNAWAVIPFNALVFRAAVLNVPDEQFEAAQLDGATPRQEFWYVILPALRPTTLVLGVLTIVYAFRSFDFVYVMTKGGPGASTQTLPYLSYQQAFVGYDFSAGAASAVVAVVVVLALAAVYARSVLKEESE